MGPCAGGAVYSPAITDFILMAENTSQMFITGPQVIKSTTGEDVTLEDLGGAFTHSSKSGVAHFASPSEQECLALVRKLLSYLPSNNMEDPPAVDCPDHIENEINFEALLDIIPDDPNRPYDVREIINLVTDPGSFLEVQPDYAANAVIGFARMQGRSIGIIANQPKCLAGCLDINASDKIARFVRTCDAFNVPIVTFVDVPGFLPGVSQEFGGIIRHGAKVLFAYSEATVPKLAVILRKSYGGAYVAMCSRSLGADAVYAWPTAEIAVMGAAGAANIIFRDDIKNAKDPEATRREKVDEYTTKFANPYIAAARGILTMSLIHCETRSALIKALNMIATERTCPAKNTGIFRCKEESHAQRGCRIFLSLAWAWSFCADVIICVMTIAHFSGTKKKAEHQVSEKSAAASVSASMNFQEFAETVAAISGAIAYMMALLRAAMQYVPSDHVSEEVVFALPLPGALIK